MSPRPVLRPNRWSCGAAPGEERHPALDGRHRWEAGAN